MIDTEANRKLRIFVAMPGKTMGEAAPYRDPERVKSNLLDPIAKIISQELSRPTEIVIEKKKLESGDIYGSMFSEALNAEVYIADLTGANPNVYLELGVRWACSDGVTIPIAQNVEGLPFNVARNRAFPYSSEEIVNAQNHIAKVIINGLMSRKCDSPVRSVLELVNIPRIQLEEMKKELVRLTEARGEDLLRAAAVTQDLRQRIKILEQVVATNPASVEGWFQLGITQRALYDYDKAIISLKRAVELDLNQAKLHRELGVTYSKSKKPELAVDSLRRATSLDPTDKEAFSNLGGALRRLARRGRADQL